MVTTQRNGRDLPASPRYLNLQLSLKGTTKVPEKSGAVRRFWTDSCGLPRQMPLPCGLPFINIHEA